MGGTNETTAKQKTVTKGKTEVVGSVRYHENDGEIHFHDDRNKMKVAVPVATWMEAWQKLERGEEITLFDAERDTCFVAELAYVPPKDGKCAFKEVAMRVVKVLPSEDFDNLKKFSTE